MDLQDDVSASQISPVPSPLSYHAPLNSTQSPSPSSSSINLPLSTSNPSLSTAPLSSLGRDLSLPPALSALIHHLTQPLAAHYPHSTIIQLRASLTCALSERFIPSWVESNPEKGSAFRSLICQRQYGLPPILRRAAADVGVDELTWRMAIAATRKIKAEVEEESKDEWEAWCDPGVVTWRWGSWEYDEPNFEPPRPKEYPQTVWIAGPAGGSSPLHQSAQLTPARPSHAIPIRPPTVLQIPPTPAQHDADETSPVSLLPAATISRPGSGIGSHSPIASGHSGRVASPLSSDLASVESDDRAVYRLKSQPLGAIDISLANKESASDSPRSGHRVEGHRICSSTSSVASSVSDSNTGTTQLLTPGSRPGSADPFIIPLAPDAKDGATSDSEASTPASTATLVAPRGRTPSPSTPASVVSNASKKTTPVPTTTDTPTVTPYDGGNVTVLGGGTKLGGSSSSSRPGSSSRMAFDRSRSPSVSIASRALSNAVGPNSNGSVPGSPRKQRTRRRIMPTYLGHLGQPGVGGPVPGAFGQFAPSLKPIPGAMYVQPGWPVGVGVGVAPPPVHGIHMASQMGMRPMSLGMQRLA